MLQIRNNTFYPHKKAKLFETIIRVWSQSWTQEIEYDIREMESWQHERTFLDKVATFSSRGNDDDY